MTLPTDVGEQRASRIREMLVATVENEPAARKRIIRRRILTWTPLALLTVGTATFAGTAIIGSSSVDSYEIVHCMAAAERGENGELQEAQAVLKSETVGRATIDDAVRICTEMWQQGVLKPGHDALNPSPERHDVPQHLTPCVMPDGSPAIVPGEAAACRALGLAPLHE